MIISRTPFRLSLFGGGHGLSTVVREHAAPCSAPPSTSIATSRSERSAFFEQSIGSSIRASSCQSGDDIVHPAVRAVLGEHPIEHGIEIHHDGDLPGALGLGLARRSPPPLNALFALQAR